MKFSAFIAPFVSKIILFLVIIVAVFSLSTFISPTLAKDQTKNNTSTKNNLSTNVNPDVPKNLHTWTQTVLIEVLSAMTCQLTGVDLSNTNQKCLGVDQKTGKIGFVKDGGGTIAVTTTMIAALYTPPAHSGDFTNYLANNFGIIKSSHAQVIPTLTGFDQLIPLLEIWKTFRNISYTFFVVVFLIIGLAIMLRTKIDPRTVMTIQNQIPKIIIGLVMVTLSYAIAGLLVDLMWTSSFVVYNVAKSVPGGNVGNLTPDNLQRTTPMGLLDSYALPSTPGDSNAGTGVAAFSNVISVTSKKVFQKTLGIAPCDNVLTCGLFHFSPISFVWDNTDRNPVSILINLVSTMAGVTTFMKWTSILGQIQTSIPFIGNIPTFLTGMAASTVAGGLMYSTVEFTLREFLPWLIIYLIVYIAMLFALIRLWFELIKCYISILIAIIFAPFWIMAGIIPGNNSLSFSSWLRYLAGNLAVFPTVIALFLVGKLLIDAFSTQGTIDKAFTPPLIGSTGYDNLLAALIGFGIILSAEQLVQAVKKAFKAQGGLGGAGAAIGMGMSIPTRAGGSAAGIYTATKYDITGAERKGQNIMGAIANKLFSR